VLLRGGGKRRVGSPQLDHRGGQPDDADGHAANGETRDALASAREIVQEFAAELEIVFGGKAGADGGTGWCGGMICD
jgi:hypothetical protein